MNQPRLTTLPPLVFLLIATASLPGSISSARAGSLPPTMAQKLDSRLVIPYTQNPDDTVSIWIEFTDKGLREGRELIEGLAAAEAALSPRARARRLRAGVRPLVDELDLPLHAPYLADLAARGFTPYASSRWFNAVALRVPARSLANLAAPPFVARLSPVERGRISRLPAGAPEPGARPARVGAVDYGLTATPLAQIGVPALHDSGYTGAGVLVAVLDAGFNFFDKHEALRDHVIPPGRQRDFPRGVYDVQDTTNIFGFRHGAWVLGCMAGRKAGTYVGAAFDAEYALARTEVTAGESHQEMVYWGMAAEWADSLGADIISSSLGYFTFDSPDPNYTYADMNGHTTIVSRAAQIAASKGILVVNSVGNEGGPNNQWHFLVAPADVNGDSLLAVGAVDALGAPASFSSYGPSADGRIKPDLAARGVQNPLVSSSGNPNQYETQSGTSFAAPLVAGLAACLMQARPQWTPVQVIAALRATASRASNPDDRVGYGIPNGAAALCMGGQGVAGAPWARLGLAGSNPVNLGVQPARFTFEFSTGTVPGRPGVVRVFDAGGRRVRELWSGVVPCPVPMTLFWDGLDDDGRPCGAGLYFIQLSAGDQKAGLRITGLR